MDEESQAEDESLLPQDSSDKKQTDKDNTNQKEQETTSQSAFLATIALVVHSLTEGIAMGSSMYLGNAMSGGEESGQSESGG